MQNANAVEELRRTACLLACCVGRSPELSSIWIGSISEAISMDRRDVPFSCPTLGSRCRLQVTIEDSSKQAELRYRRAAVQPRHGILS
jgi:hypothetical protein